MATKSHGHLHAQARSTYSSKLVLQALTTWAAQSVACVEYVESATASFGSVRVSPDKHDAVYIGATRYRLDNHVLGLLKQRISESLDAYIVATGKVWTLHQLRASLSYRLSDAEGRIPCGLSQQDVMFYAHVVPSRSGVLRE